MDNAESSSARDEVAETVSPEPERMPENNNSTSPSRRPKRNLMLEKWQAVEREGFDLDEFYRETDEALDKVEAQKREGKELYFFYGSLMYPEMLRHALQLPELPRLRPAEVVGYHVKLWGSYSAFFDGESVEPVRRMAYEVEGGEQKDRLQNYETDCYRTSKCLICLDGEEEKVLGTIFMWNGDTDELDEGVLTMRAGRPIWVGSFVISSGDMVLSGDLGVSTLD